MTNKKSIPMMDGHNDPIIRQTSHYALHLKVEQSFAHASLTLKEPSISILLSSNPPPPPPRIAHHNCDPSPPHHPLPSFWFICSFSSLLISQAFSYPLAKKKRMHKKTKKQHLRKGQWKKSWRSNCARIH